MSARATPTPFGEIALHFPFSAELVDDLKAEIPSRYRRWDGDEKRWLILGAYAPAAIDLLLEHFPGAAVPDDAPRRVPSTPARTKKPLPRPPAMLPAIPAAADLSPPDPLTVTLACPRCHARLEQPVRITVQSGERVARTAAPPAEFVSVCPGCRSLLIVGVLPAVAPVAA